MRKSWFLVPLVALFALVGCGGLGGVLVNPIQGSFSGTFTTPGAVDTGTANFTVAQNGAVNGTVHDNVTKLDGTITGTIGLAGQFNGAIAYPGQSPGTDKGAFVLTNGVLSGTLVQNQGGTQTQISFTLTKQ